MSARSRGYAPTSQLAFSSRRREDARPSIESATYLGGTKLPSSRHILALGSWNRCVPSFPKGAVLRWHPQRLSHRISLIHHAIVTVGIKVLTQWLIRTQPTTKPCSKRLRRHGRGRGVRKNNSDKRKSNCDKQNMESAGCSIAADLGYFSKVVARWTAPP